MGGKDSFSNDFISVFNILWISAVSSLQGEK